MPLLLEDGSPLLLEDGSMLATGDEAVSLPATPLPRPPTRWTDQYTHSVATYGEHEPPGEGSFGGTEWTPPAAIVTAWTDQFTHSVGEYGEHEPPGEGSYGGTEWEEV